MPTAKFVAAHLHLLVFGLCTELRSAFAKKGSEFTNHAMNSNFLPYHTTNS
jgi:hypothetical protein